MLPCYFFLIPPISAAFVVYSLGYLLHGLQLTANFHGLGFQDLGLGSMVDQGSRVFLSRFIWLRKGAERDPNKNTKSGDMKCSISEVSEVTRKSLLVGTPFFWGGKPKGGNLRCQCHGELDA